MRTPGWFSSDKEPPSCPGAAAALELWNCADGEGPRSKKTRTEGTGRVTRLPGAVAGRALGRGDPRAGCRDARSIPHSDSGEGGERGAEPLSVEKSNPESGGERRWVLEARQSAEAGKSFSARAEMRGRQPGSHGRANEPTPPPKPPENPPNWSKSPQITPKSPNFTRSPDPRALGTARPHRKIEWEVPAP